MPLPPHASGAAAELAGKHAAEHPTKLYGAWFSPFVQRVWITLCEKNVPHQYIEVDLGRKEPEFLAMNPRGLVPILALAADQRPLYESSLICEYLEDKFPHHQLLPSDPYTRAHARLWINHINTRIIPAFYKFLQHTTDRSYSLEEIRTEFLGHIRSFTEQMHSQGPWFLGEDISLVDISLAPWAQRLWLLDHFKIGGAGIPLKDRDDIWQRWSKWYSAVMKRQSVQETWSEDEKYIITYQRYADDTTKTLIGQATRLGQMLP